MLITHPRIGERIRRLRARDNGRVGHTREMTVGANKTTEGEPPALSDQLERWLAAEGDRSLGSLVRTFGEKSFAILLVLLLVCRLCRCRPAGSPTCSS
jgi:hypothetical protein